MKDQRLEISFTQEEYEQVRKNAKLYGMSISEYIRKTAGNMQTLNVEYKSVNEHFQYLFENSRVIMQLVFTIIKRDDYVPQDLEYILDVSKSLLESEKKFLDKFKLEQVKNEKCIAKYVREMVKNRVSSGDKNEKKI